MPVEPVVHRPSRVLPGITLAVGGAGVVAGAILYFTSDVDDYKPVPGTSVYWYVVPG